MNWRGIRERAIFFWESFGPVGKAFMVLYGVFGFAVLIRDNFTSAQTQQQYATMALLPRISWYWWVIVFGLIVVVGLLEGAYRAHKRRSGDIPPHTMPDHIPLAPKIVDTLPLQRPIITPTRYGRSADGYAGLFVKNDGEPAFDVTIPNAISVGTSKLSSWNALPRFDKVDGERLFDIHIDLGNGSGTFGTALRDELIRANLDSVEVSIRYKDFNNQWYATICSLERHFQLGIYPRFIRQELAAPPLVEREKPEVLAISASDPRVVMEFSSQKLPFDARNEWIGERPVFLRNDGGDIAYTCR